jgi:hypothetical protein
MSIRRILSKLAENSLGDRVRCYAGYNPPHLIRPRRAGSAVSDLMPWRRDGAWQTRFELMNLPSLISPEIAPQDDAELIFFDNDGNEIGRQQFKLAAFASETLIVSDLAPGAHAFGTFACFHSSAGNPVLDSAGSLIGERGYVGFRRDEDALWSFVHGNFNALAKPAPAGGSPESIHGWAAQPRVYRPQTSFTDCARAELFLTNPTAMAQSFKISGTSTDGRETFSSIGHLSPKGCAVVDIPNAERETAIVTCVGRPMMWRPVIFKHYETHFDVYHS